MRYLLVVSSFLIIIAKSIKQQKSMPQKRFLSQYKALGCFNGIVYVPSIRVFLRISGWSLLWITSLVHDMLTANLYWEYTYVDYSCDLSPVGVGYGCFMYTRI